MFRHLAIALILSAQAPVEASEEGHIRASLAPGSIICAFHEAPSGPDIKEIHDARPEAVKAIGWISDLIGIAPTFDLYAATFSASPTAFASHAGDRRIIVYDLERFSNIDGQLSWFDLGVFAHEVGHHVNGHLAAYPGSSWEAELEADRFAGFVIAKLGGTLEQALTKTAGYSEQGSDSHPPRSKRVDAITIGWAKGRNSLD